MRDFTHILETEVLPTLKEQADAFCDIQPATRCLFDTIQLAEKALNHAEGSAETRCKDSVAAHEGKIKQLEDDIASMIKQMKD